MNAARTTQILAGLLALFALSAAAQAQSSFESESQSWRQQREEKLKADDGWLTVSGLFWLKEGVNTVGSSPANNIVLPPQSAPAHVGEFEYREGKTVFRAVKGVVVTANDQPIREIELKSDEVKKPDVLRVADLSLLLLKRGERYAIRLKDKNARTRREFTGLNWYAPDETFRVVARFIPYDQPKEVNVVNILGDTEKMKSPGYVVFKLNGQEYSLEPVASGDRLFFIFRDLTSGKTTYKPGRFLYADAAKDGQVILDFNQAINPPCTFTAFATCPLPTKRNHLQVAIEAGEKPYGDPTGSHGVTAEASASVK
jgi:uncharacterized protein (DUF1684 family)